jgi:hypothetical protein
VCGPQDTALSEERFNGLLRRDPAREEHLDLARDLAGCRAEFRTLGQQRFDFAPATAADDERMSGSKKTARHWQTHEP